MLGVCVTATEDGDSRLLAAPRDGAKAIGGRIASHTRARPISFSVQESEGVYLYVEILEGPRKGATGWLYEGSYYANPYESCWNRR